MLNNNNSTNNQASAACEINAKVGLTTEKSSIQQGQQQTSAEKLENYAKKLEKFMKSIVSDENDDNLEDLFHILNTLNELKNENSWNSPDIFGRYLQDIRTRVSSLKMLIPSDVLEEMEEISLYIDDLSLKDDNSELSTVRQRKPSSILKQSEPNSNNKCRTNNNQNQRRVRFVSESENLIYHIPLVRKRGQISLLQRFLTQLLPVLVCIVLWYIAFYYIIMWYLRYINVISP